MTARKKVTNPETGAMIEGYTVGADIARGGRSGLYAAKCVNCLNWSHYEVGEPVLCHSCGQDPRVQGAMMW